MVQCQAGNSLGLGRVAFANGSTRFGPRGLLLGFARSDEASAGHLCAVVFQIEHPIGGGEDFYGHRDGVVPEDASKNGEDCSLAVAAGPWPDIEGDSEPWIGAASPFDSADEGNFREWCRSVVATEPTLVRVVVGETSDVAVGEGGRYRILSGQNQSCCCSRPVLSRSTLAALPVGQHEAIADVAREFAGLGREPNGSAISRNLTFHNAS